MSDRSETTPAPERSSLDEPVAGGPDSAAPSPSTAPAGREPAWWSRHGWTLMALVIGLLIAGWFVYGYLNAQGLRRDSGVFPSFLATLGMGLMLLAVIEQAVKTLRRRRQEPAADELAAEDELTADVELAVEGEDDVSGFNGVEPGGVIRAFLAIVLLFGGTMVVGFHLAIPTFVVLYTAIWGGVRSWWKLTTIWASLLLTILVVYGYFMNTPWPRSLLEDWLERDMQRLLMPYLRPVLNLLGL